MSEYAYTYEYIWNLEVRVILLLKSVCDGWMDGFYTSPTTL